MILELEIDALAFGGSGVGRHRGKAVFVPFTAPGDRIRCRIVQDKKRHAVAELEEILSPSPARREPPCPVFGACGGCQWQHLGYEEQCRWKEEIFFDTLRRRCGSKPDSLLPLLPAAEEWGYRSRVQFKCRQTKDGFVMGFYRRGSHFVIDVAHCPISAAPINDALALFRRWLPLSPCPDRIPQVDLAFDDEQKVRAIVHVLDENQTALTDYLLPLAREAGISLLFQSGRKETLRTVWGEEDLHILPAGEGGIRCGYGPGGFAQVNLDQNRNLVRAVVAGAGMTGRERVLDLFCGMGNFSLPLALGGAEVVGVEDYFPSIAKARENAAANGVGNAVFYARPAEGAALGLGGSRGFDLVVLDPPRTGAYAVAKELLQVRPEKIVYVSCDPQTLARDLTPLLHGGYELRWSRPFDLFPQTYHTESVTLLALGS